MRIIRFYFIPLLPVSLGLLLFTLSCQNQNEEDLFGVRECDTSSVSFSENINPIIMSNCIHCHYEGQGAIAPFSLEGYNNVLIRVNTGQLEGAVNHLPGSPRMPQDGPKLPECELSLINKWILEGAPNN